jgi:Fic family protein
LYEKEVLTQPMFYLSGYLETHRDDYIARLRALGEKDGAWNDWISFFLTALIEQAQENASKARAILDLYERLKGRVIELTHSQFAVPLLDHLFVQPIIRSSDLSGAPGMPSKPMIMALLTKLKQDGILQTITEGRGRRAQVLAIGELINLCEGRHVFKVGKPKRRLPRRRRPAVV